MDSSKLQQRVIRTRTGGCKLLEFSFYCGPSGSGESRVEPRRANLKRDGALTGIALGPIGIRVSPTLDPRINLVKAGLKELPGVAIVNAGVEEG